MCPGWVRTDMGGSGAPRSVEEGADTAVWLATCPTTGRPAASSETAKPIPGEMASTQDLIKTAIERFQAEVPALAQLKLVFELELRGRGDVQMFRVELPGPKISKAASTEDARVTVEFQRAEFNQLAEEGHAGRLPRGVRGGPHQGQRRLGDPEADRAGGRAPRAARPDQEGPLGQVAGDRSDAAGPGARRHAAAPPAGVRARIPPRSPGRSPAPRRRTSTPARSPSARAAGS